MKFKNITDVGVPGVTSADALGVRYHFGDLFLDLIRCVPEVNRIVVAFAHFTSIETEYFRRFGQNGFGSGNTSP